MATTAIVTTANVTIDIDGKLALPPEIVGVLRSDGESLTLVDVQVQDGAIVLRRSTIPEEDWWAYTPEHRADVEAALNEENGGIRMTLPELERFVRDRGR